MLSGQTVDALGVREEDSESIVNNLAEQYASSELYLLNEKVKKKI